MLITFGKIFYAQKKSNKVAHAATINPRYAYLISTFTLVSDFLPPLN